MLEITFYPNLPMFPIDISPGMIRSRSFWAGDDDSITWNVVFHTNREMGQALEVFIDCWSDKTFLVQTYMGTREARFTGSRMLTKHPDYYILEADIELRERRYHG